MGGSAAARPGWTGLRLPRARSRPCYSGQPGPGTGSGRAACRGGPGAHRGRQPGRRRGRIRGPSARRRVAFRRPVAFRRRGTAADAAAWLSAVAGRPPMRNCRRPARTAPWHGPGPSGYPEACHQARAALPRPPVPSPVRPGTPPRSGTLSRLAVSPSRSSSCRRKPTTMSSNSGARSAARAAAADLRVGDVRRRRIDPRPDDPRHRPDRHDTTLTPDAHLTPSATAFVSELRPVVSSYAAAGIRDVLALRGDPPGGPAAPWVAHPYGLPLRRRARLGSSVPSATSASAWPPSRTGTRGDGLRGRRRAAWPKKCVAGADFAITQFFFASEAYFRLVDRVAALGCDLPMTPGDHAGHPDVLHGRAVRRGVPGPLGPPGSRKPVRTRQR